MTELERKKRMTTTISLLARSELKTKNLVAILEVLNKELQDSVSRFQNVWQDNCMKGMPWKI